MKYRKKPVVINAIQWSGKNMDDVIKFSDNSDSIGFSTGGLHCYIRTLEGDMRCGIDDFIIKGVKGEFYPCKPDIFEMTYEVVEG